MNSRTIGLMVSVVVTLGFLAGCVQRKEANPRAVDKGNVAPAKEVADKEWIAQVKALSAQANALSDSGKYAEALIPVRKMVEIGSHFPGNLKYREEVLDFQHYLLQKTAAFPEALATAFELEELAARRSPRRSPWNCLKIADSYLGMHDLDNAVLWIEKAVNERDFTRLDALTGELYAPLQKNARFRKAMAVMERKVGIGAPAREFALRLLDGTPFSLADQRGRVVLIDFWDVRCPPCRKEMPNLQRMHREFAARGLVILSISLDTERSLLEDFLKELAPEWRIACSFQGWNDETAKLYHVNATPSSWLVDRQGILRQWNLRGEELFQAVEALL